MSNDSTLRLRYPTGANLYTQIEAPDGTFFNGTAYSTFSVASWGTFAVSTPETPASSGRYVAQFPTSSPAGFYTWATYLRAGGSPASTDVCVGNGSGTWDGSSFGSAVATLPTPAPTGYGPIGTGSVAVNQDYPTTGNLKYVDGNGSPIAGASVRAYVSSEYNANPNTAVIRGQTLTRNDGTWANNLDLTPTTYSITFDAPGYETTVVSQVVS